MITEKRTTHTHKRGHINSVMYPSGFRVPCTKAEKCGVDSPLAGQSLTCTTLQHVPADDKYDLVAGHHRAWLCI